MELEAIGKVAVGAVVFIWMIKTLISLDKTVALLAQQMSEFTSEAKELKDHRQKCVEKFATKEELTIIHNRVDDVLQSGVFPRDEPAK